MEPLTFTVDKRIVERIQAARIARSRVQNASSHPDAQAKEIALEELCSIALAELTALHAVPHLYRNNCGEIEAGQAAALRHEIGDMLASIVDGSIELETLSVQTVRHLIGAHRQAETMLVGCKGTTEQFGAIAALLRHVHAAASIS
jgi:hypothetical protein